MSGIAVTRTAGPRGNLSRWHLWVGHVFKRSSEWQHVLGPVVSRVGRLLFSAAGLLVECVVRSGAAINGDRQAAVGAQRALADRRRVRDEVANGLRAIERFLVEAARR